MAFLSRSAPAAGYSQAGRDRRRNPFLGQDVLNGQYLQYTVPGGCWFGATPAEGSDFALVGCTVAPGFDFADFEMADPDVLGQTFPHAAGLVREFC